MTNKRGLAAPGESYYWDEPRFRFAYTVDWFGPAVKQSMSRGPAARWRCGRSKRTTLK